ncbi:MAG: hypothetical protein WDZ88_03805 [Candidatus Paceibacterota bacterium]
MQLYHFSLGRFVRNVFIVTASIVATILLVRLGIIESFIGESFLSLVIASFVSGVFFTSVFTVAPAGVALIAISQSLSPLYVAFFGALGAMLIDMLIIHFVRKDLTVYIDGFVKRVFRTAIIKVFEYGFLKWVAFAFGLFLVATPLPDEFGLFLIGISKVSPRFLPLIFFISHFLGILAVVSIALVVL